MVKLLKRKNQEYFLTILKEGLTQMFVKFKRYKFLVIVLSLLLILISSSFAYEQKSTGYLEVIG
ncbi:hypothetical protein CYK23_03800 [Streptococcus salivarius]|jgi:hypothetical protein|nr:hypothetical protein CYK23_03800 [Streptococcus salivarius]